MCSKAATKADRIEKSTKNTLPKIRKITGFYLVSYFRIQFIHGNIHCIKSVHIRSFSGSYFPAFRLNTERYFVSLRIQSKCGKIRTRKTPKRTLFTKWIAELIIYGGIPRKDYFRQLNFAVLIWVNDGKF